MKIDDKYGKMFGHEDLVHHDTIQFRKKDIDKLIRVWKKRLRMDYFVVVFEPDEEPEGESNATIFQPTDYQYAYLAMRPGWQTIDPLVMNVRIVHELLHLVFRDMDGVVKNYLSKLLHNDAAMVVTEQYQHHNEGVIERLALILVDGYGVVKTK